MQLEIKATFDNAEEAAIFLSRFAGVAGVAGVAEAPASGKPEKPKKDKPETKVIDPQPDTKVESKPEEKVESKPDVKPLSEWDISTPEAIENCRVKLRAKASALNEAGYMELTRKALTNVGAGSITKMEPIKFITYWDLLLQIEAGQKI